MLVEELGERWCREVGAGVGARRVRYGALDTRRVGHGAARSRPRIHRWTGRRPSVCSSADEKPARQDGLPRWRSRVSHMPAETAPDRTRGQRSDALPRDDCAGRLALAIGLSSMRQGDGGMARGPGNRERRRVDFVAARGDGEDFKILDVRREGAVRGVVDGGGENGEALLVTRTCKV